MASTAKNPLARLEHRRVNYLQVVVSVVLVGVLVAGIVLSIRAEIWYGAALFGAGVGVFVLVILIHTAQNRRLAAIDDRKFIRWDEAQKLDSIF